MKTRITFGEACYAALALIIIFGMAVFLVLSKKDKARDLEFSRRACSTITHVDVYGQPCTRR